jgi:N-acetylglucosamine kinase-like BadF-type ATPase
MPRKPRPIESSETTYLLAIESGGSGTRIALADAAGQLVRLEACGSGSPLYRDPYGFADAFVAALQRVLHGISPGNIRVAGLAGPVDRELVLNAITHEVPRVPVLEFTEGDLARGLYGITAGVALVAGTGCSCSAIDEQGVVTSLAGYGPQFGDEGSAYWIGREGLKAAFHAEQGRIAPTALLEAVRRFYGVASPWDLLVEAADGGHIPAPRVASFAGEVNHCAEGEDEAAEAILVQAGTHLGELIIETARHASFLGTPVPLAMSGGALRSDYVVAALRRSLEGSPITFHVHPVAHEPIAGLIKLLQRSNEARTD